MITLRRAAERGITRTDWLDSRHSFSFGEYFDPRHESFRSLRVLNDDRIAGGGGFGMHPHRDFEIVTYVVSGSVQHRDSLGHQGTIGAGEVQRMTAGTGILHSEFNPSAVEPLHLLQIWLTPERRGLTPSYEQRLFAAEERRARWRLLASSDGRDGSVTIHQDVAILGSLLEPGDTIRHELSPGRHAWLQVARGKIGLNGQAMMAGDGAALSDESALIVTAREGSELLLFDLA
jgi:redox-sensitive bicupin YhaK (pirin superfamily)